MLPVSTDRAERSILSTDFSSERSRRSEDTTAYWKASLPSILRWQKKKKGVTGDNLLSIVESRLDNVVYRLGFAMFRPEARQLVRHGHFTVNGKKVNIPSYLLNVGDVIAVNNDSLSSEKIKSIIEANEKRAVVKWLERDGTTGKVIGICEKEDIDLPIEEHLIVELYSK